MFLLQCTGLRWKFSHWNFWSCTRTDDGIRTSSCAFEQGFCEYQMILISGVATFIPYLSCINE